MKAHLKPILSTLFFVVCFVLRITVGSHPIMIILPIFIGTPIFIQALKNLRYRIVGIDLLVSLAVIGALFLQDYWEACAVSYLFYIGSVIEYIALSKSRQIVKSLIVSVPDTVHHLVDGVEHDKSIKSLGVGDTIVVRQGEMIPVDGMVVSGDGSVNQSSITGESLPVDKSEHESVFAGTYVLSGYLIITIQEIGTDTIYAGIIQFVEDAQDSKTKTQLMIERFATIYTPLIIVASLLSYLITKDLRIALSLLVVSCPGALVIATPITIASAIGAAGRHSVLVKSGHVLETLSHVDTFAFDKTGTLTIGVLNVSKVITQNHNYPVLKLAAIGERYSEHPIGRAILDHIDYDVPIAQDYELIQGKGIIFTYENNEYRVGNKSLFPDATIPASVSSDIIIYLGSKSEIYGMILLRDTPRGNTRNIIDRLPDTVMITGDETYVAHSIARECGIKTVYANTLPKDKASVIKALQSQGSIAMVGDGVNDAPALIQADVGISVGGASNSVAMDTADIVLMDGTLDNLNLIVNLSKQMTRIMKQNLGLALITTCLLIAGILTSHVTLGLGMFVHELTIFLVIINALRIHITKG